MIISFQGFVIANDEGVKQPRKKPVIASELANEAILNIVPVTLSDNIRTSYRTLLTELYLFHLICILLSDRP